MFVFFLPCSCYICRWMDRKQHDCLQVCGPCLMSVGAHGDVKRQCGWGEWLTGRPSVSAPIFSSGIPHLRLRQMTHRFHFPARISLRDKNCMSLKLRHSRVSLSLGLCQLSSYAKFMMFSLPWGLFCIQAGLDVDLGCDLTCVGTELVSDVWLIAMVNQISFLWLPLACVSL